MAKPLIIGYGGGSGSGKTSIALAVMKNIEQELNIKGNIISTDNFYKQLTEEEKVIAALNEFNFDHPQTCDFDLLH